MSGARRSQVSSVRTSDAESVDQLVGAEGAGTAVGVSNAAPPTITGTPSAMYGVDASAACTRLADREQLSATATGHASVTNRSSSTGDTDAPRWETSKPSRPMIVDTILAGRSCHSPVGHATPTATAIGSYGIHSRGRRARRWRSWRARRRGLRSISPFSQRSPTCRMVGASTRSRTRPGWTPPSVRHGRGRGRVRRSPYRAHSQISATSGSTSDASVNERGGREPSSWSSGKDVIASRFLRRG